MLRFVLIITCALNVSIHYFCPAQSLVIIEDDSEILEISSQDIAGAPDDLETFESYQVIITIDNKSKNQEWLLYTGYWTDIEVNYQKTSIDKTLHTGHFVPMGERPYQVSPHLYIPLTLVSNSKTKIRLRLNQEMRFYLPSQMVFKLYSAKAVKKEERQRLWYQGIFFGLILVMALYNLLIYVAVRDISFLYYVLSILGVGLYFLFYYGFLFELFWCNMPRWNALSFAFIVPLTRIFWVLFTKSYLNLAQILPRWNRLINWLIILYIPPMLVTSWSLYTGQDYSLFITNWIGFMGVLVLSSMIVLGVWAWQKGYRPAKYFILASITFSLGSIIFIFREIGYLPDTIFTRYVGQIGIVAQVTLFSLGLAYRLNTARQELVEKELEQEKLKREQEKERQKLIEEQKVHLETEVAERTADLKKVVSQLKSSEQNLKDLNALKDRLFSIIAHDTRSPLATLSSFLNILINFTKDIKPEELQHLATQTQQSVENLSQLLDNLLQWAMSQMKRTQFNPQKVNLYEEMKQVTTLLAPSAKQKKLKLVMQVSPNLEVFADRQMLAFVIRNLISNAIKFSPEEKTVYLEAKSENSNIRISIQDEGLGIAPENQARIFHPTQTFTTLGTKQEKGVGLGLLLSKEFVENHQSQLQLESEPGKGSRFSFSLPMVDYQ